MVTLTSTLTPRSCCPFVGTVDVHSQKFALLSTTHKSLRTGALVIVFSSSLNIKVKVPSPLLLQLPLFVTVSSVVRVKSMFPKVDSTRVSLLLLTFMTGEVSIVVTGTLRSGPLST